MLEWCHRPLDRVYPVIFIDAIVVKVRDGQVTNRPVYVAIGVTVSGERDILGLWAGDGSEGAKFWLGVLTEIKNRGVQDVCIAVCDGLGPARLDHDRLAAGHRAGMHHPFDSEHVPVRLPQGLGRPVQGSAAGLHRADRGCRLGEVRRVHRDLGRAVPGDHRPVDGIRAVPLDYDMEIRRIICPANGIESLNARFRRAVRARGHFPTEQAALKCLYLVTRSLDLTGRGRARWAIRWKPALNAFAITFENRLTPSTTN